jgi:hypothetical protein
MIDTEKQMAGWAAEAITSYHFDYIILIRNDVMATLYHNSVAVIQHGMMAFGNIQICDAFAVSEARAVYFLKSTRRDKVLPSRYLQFADIVIKFIDGEPGYIKDRRCDTARYNHRAVFRADLDAWCTFLR